MSRNKRDEDISLSYKKDNRDEDISSSKFPSLAKL